MMELAIKTQVFYTMINCIDYIIIDQFKMNKSKEVAGYLVILAPPELVSRVPFYMGENIIGRSESKATVVVKDFSISQKHARLIVTPQTMTLSDIGSKNGVKINSEGNQLVKFTEVTIDESMIIFLAEAKCKFVREKSNELLNCKSLTEPNGAKEKKTTQIVNLFLEDDEAKKQQNQTKNKKQFHNDATLNDEFNIDKAFQKQPKKQEKSKIVNISKKSIETVFIDKSGKEEGKGVREEKQKKVKNEKPIIIDQNDSKPVSKKEAKNSLKPLNQKRQEKQSPKEVKKEERREEENKQESNNPKLGNKQAKDNKLEKKQIQTEKQKQLSVDKEDKNQKKAKRKTKENKTKNISQNGQGNSKSQNQVIPLKIKTVTDKSKSALASRDQSENQSDLTGIQKPLPFSTKRRVQNRKRLPTESILKQAGLVPQRRSFLNKRVLVSGFTPQLNKKYFQIMETIEDEFDFLVMKEYKRTFKALFCICKGIPIVKYDWLRESEMFEKTLKYDNYYFKEHPYIYESIEKAKVGNRVLNGYIFYLGSDQFHLKIEDIQILIVAAGGEVMKKVGKLTEKERKNHSIFAVIRNLQDKKKEEFEADLKKAKKFGFERIYTIQMILDSIETQEIDWQKNRVQATGN